MNTDLSSDAGSPVTITLYSGQHCHLCDQAKALVYPLLPEFNATLEVVDIAGNPQLQELYGIRIPVLKMPNGEEKGWPFSAGQVRRLLSGITQR